MSLWQVRRRIEVLLHTRLTTGGLADDEAAELAALYAEEEELTERGDATNDERNRD